MSRHQRKYFERFKIQNAQAQQLILTLTCAQ